MAESDFSIIGASAADIARGVTAGFTKPYGGGNFTFGFNSRVDGGAATVLYYNAANFAPLRDDDGNATGGSVRAALMRGRSVTSTGYSVFLVMNLQGTSEDDTAYLLGLSDDDPATIVLAKTTPLAGLDPDAGSTVKLASSTSTYLWDVWVQLRLDAICNPNGDVVLKCKQSNLSVYPVTAPVWEDIPGMSAVIDDSLGITTQANPLAGGYAGFGFSSTKAQCRGFVAQFEFKRQM